MRDGLALAVLPLSVLLLSTTPALAQSEGDAPTEAERYEALRDDASDEERALLEQAEAALEAMDDVGRDEAGRERARALCDAALGVIESRREERAARRALEAATERLEAARSSRDRARARRARSGAGAP